MSLDELERRFLRAAQQELGPAPADRERNQAALFDRLGAWPTSGAGGGLSLGAGAPLDAASQFTSVARSGAGVGGVAAALGSRFGMLGVGLIVGALVGGGFGFGLGRSGWNAPAHIAEITASPAAPSTSSEASLSEASLSEASLSEASLSEASLAGAEPRAPVLAPDVPVEEGSARVGSSVGNFVDSAAPGDLSRPRALAASGARATRRAEALARPGSSLAAELALLQRARRALNAENARLALGIVQELDERFPKGVLVEERSATRILSLCQLEQVGEAKRAASDFLARFPGSVYAERVRQSCAASR